MRKLTLLLMLIPILLYSQPKEWVSSGVGGGGAFYAASVNPDNHDEYYVSSDMSGVYHTSNYGQSYELLPFYNLQGGHFSFVRYTNIQGLRYSLSYADDMAVPVRSSDGGKTWSKFAPEPLSSEVCYSLFVDYNNPSRIIVSTYSEVFCSTNGGSTFNIIHDAEDIFSGIVIGGAFFDGNNIYLGTNDGILVSSNGGQTFTVDVIPGIPTGEKIWSFAAAKQGNTTRFFCLTGGDVWAGMMGSDYWQFVLGVYSVDYGKGAWQTRMNGLDIDVDYVMFLGMAENNINTVYLAGSTDQGEPNILKSTNAGASWTHIFLTTGNQNITTGWCGDGGDRSWGYAECVFSFTVAGNDPNRLVFTDYGFVHNSTDGGTSWKQAYLNNNLANQAGKQTPTGKAYSGISLENTSCWQVFWSDESNIFACFSDIKGIRSTDGGQNWSFNYSGHSANTMYRIAQVGNKIYAATSDIHDLYQSTRLMDDNLDKVDNNGKIIVSNDKGETWIEVHKFGHPVFWIASDPGNPDKMYASVVHHTEGGIFMTNDLSKGAGSTWTKLTSPPRTEGHPSNIVVLKDGLVLCSYSGRMYPKNTFTKSSGVFIYDPANGSWSDVSDPGMYYWTKDIVPDPTDASQNTWYVCVYSGWGGAANGLGGLYRTTNRGANWTKINSLDRVASCTFNPSNPKEMYLTTETNGLWFCSDIKAASPVFKRVDSYGFRQPERVFFNPYKSNEIWVASFGNGMRIGLTDEIKVPGAPVLISPANGASNQELSLIIKWNSVSGAQNYEYNVSRKNDFQENVAAAEISLTEAKIEGLEPGLTYYWRARAKNSAGFGAWSETWSFTAKNDVQPPQAPILAYPENNAKDLPVNLGFRWNKVPGADGYDINVSRNEAFTDLAVDSQAADTLYEATGLDYNTKYYWRVRSAKSGLKSTWSSAWNFTTANNTGVVELETEMQGVSAKYNNGTNCLELSFDSSVGECRVKVFNSISELVLTRQVHSHAHTEINLSGLLDGFYFYQLIYNNYVHSGKFLINK